ncbi:molecular chaperone GrpE [Actinoplanes sp. NPDC051411]|uniref:molecular chaperone GrpE n=1 Tax=Actinoplanes sp. NPDC051411 TaxID=3155522 RepID=UPI00342E008A
MSELPAGPAVAEDAPPDAALLVRLASIEDALRAFHQRSAHRETVIDRLHEENQVLREGTLRTLLQPVVTDLLKLHDSLSQQALRAAAEPDRAAGRDLWASFADDVAMTLERCGTEIITAVPGEAYTRGRHVAAGYVDHPDPPPGEVVAEVAAAGLVDRENGRIRRPVRVRLYRAAAPEQSHEGPAGAQ